MLKLKAQGTGERFDGADLQSGPGMQKVMVWKKGHGLQIRASVGGRIVSRIANPRQRRKQERVTDYKSAPALT